MERQYKPGELSECAKTIFTFIKSDAHSSYFSRENSDKMKERLTDLKTKTDNLAEYKIVFKTIIELSDVGQRVLDCYRLDVKDDSKENLLKVNDIFKNAIYSGFEKDKNDVKDLKKEVDSQIKKVDDYINKISYINNDEGKKEKISILNLTSSAVEKLGKTVSDIELMIVQSIDKTIIEHEKIIKALKEKEESKFEPTKFEPTEFKITKFEPTKFKPTEFKI